MEDMKCKEFNQWLDDYWPSHHQYILPADIEQHITECDHCRNEKEIVVEISRFIDQQKQLKLSDNKTSEITGLILNSNKRRSDLLKPVFYINRVAAILIIVFGLIAGLIAGSLFLTESAEAENWDAEFSLLADETDYSLFD
jgi:predicted anti-sigma-YlaC factor YlaD